MSIPVDDQKEELESSGAIMSVSRSSIMSYPHRVTRAGVSHASVSLKVEQDHLWCQDRNGYPPANPCNTHGSQHHCADSTYSGKASSHNIKMAS